MTRHRPILVSILVAGAALRLGLWLWCMNEPIATHGGDEVQYNELAVGLVRDHEFRLEGQLCSMRPPLYPLFVAGIYACFGLENYQAVRGTQALLSLATAALVYLLGRRLYDRRVGLWAAGMATFYPPLLGINYYLFTETLFTFWLVLFCLCVVRALGSGGDPVGTRQEAPRSGLLEALGWWAAAGVVLGLASLTRSILWLFPPVLGLFVLLAWQESFARRLAAAGLVVACFAATIAPWSIRCSRLEKTFVTIDVMGGRNLMMGNYEHTPTFRAWDAISIGEQDEEKSWYRAIRKDHPEFPTLTQGQRDKLALRYGLSYMLEHPGQTALRSTVKFFNFWQLDRTLVAGLGNGWFGGLPKPAVLLLAAVVFGSYAAAVIAAVFGAVLVPPRDLRALVFLLLLIGYVCGLHSLVFAHSRYHLPLAPVELVFAAAAVVQGRGKGDKSNLCEAPGGPLRGKLDLSPFPLRSCCGTRRFWLAAGLCAVLVGGWVWEIVAVDLAKFLEVFGR